MEFKRAVVNTAMNLRVPQNVEELSNCCRATASSKTTLLHLVTHPVTLSLWRHRGDWRYNSIYSSYIFNVWHFSDRASWINYIL